MLEQHGLELDTENMTPDDMLDNYKRLLRAVKLLTVAGILEPHNFHEAMYLAELFE